MKQKFKKGQKVIVNDKVSGFGNNGGFKKGETLTVMGYENSFIYNTPWVIMENNSGAIIEEYLSPIMTTLKDLIEK